MASFSTSDFMGRLVECGTCGKGGEEHTIFPFVSMPDEHRGVYPCPPEWLPNADEGQVVGGGFDERIDPYPARVAYKFSDGEPTVQVHEGDGAGLWVPCAWHVEDGITYWFCKLRGPKNPCGVSYMRDIST